MANKKFWLGLVLVIGFVFAGCAVTRPIAMTTVAHSKDFIILGEVTYQSTLFSQRQGYLDFWAEAKKKYPQADYVIDVMVDTREGRRFIFFKKFDYLYRGTAIQYIR